jgi:hypothetical protein
MAADEHEHSATALLNPDEITLDDNDEDEEEKDEDEDEEDKEVEAMLIDSLRRGASAQGEADVVEVVVDATDVAMVDGLEGTAPKVEEERGKTTKFLALSKPGRGRDFLQVRRPRPRDFVFPSDKQADC